ncbi:hypothetical protein K443DRAFT_678841 [Laccaria amethystina LaAM-08-1]|uniref:Uncharacterized protein n=1 Tax=Laccaria amethystina LaAM-08-1 TaxID=1095629 RepID=A0A0C9X786_9AGAR|nr:hypothetical protein K443DRAFT_678841 [Laccaria amethystina LaAM-08-1]
MGVDTSNVQPSRQNGISQLPRRWGTSKTDTMLAVSDTIVSMLKDVVTLSGLPFIQEAASVALTILEILQNVRNNKGDFGRLANDACEITYAAALMCNEYEKKHQPISETTKEDLKELVRKLKNIEQYAYESIQRKWYWKLANNKSDQGKIAAYRQDLNSSVALFGFQSHLTIREAVAKLEQQSEKIEQQQMKILQELKDQEVRRSEEARATIPLGKEEAPKARRGVTGGSGSRTVSPLRINQGVWGFRHPDFVESPTSQISFTSIAGNKSETNNSTTITNTNSGNNRTMTISESNNDNSVRHYGNHRRGSRR